MNKVDRLMLNAIEHEEVRHFLLKHAGNKSMIEMIAFWGTYPDANFTKSIVSNLANRNKNEVGTLLTEMLNEAILDSRIKNGAIFYSLTEDGIWRKAAIALAALGRSQRKMVLEQILGNQNENKSTK